MTRLTYLYYPAEFNYFDQDSQEWVKAIGYKDKVLSLKTSSVFSLNRIYEKSLIQYPIRDIEFKEKSFIKNSKFLGVFN